ncbi:LD-carboxypeptidase [Pedobacter sp. SYSU D00535]|uniref:S66 peptidase family protein n=1 Tax=Pedobacter sp. SYSU D00535 TaxID=2810308 RepID=UPI001A96E550|nr:LD-carboxypeptidase [Pedobacter sp. SYSU D00535]
MYNAPPLLKKGDKIAITCPAKKLPHGIESAIDLLKSWGLEVVLGDTINASHHQFAGDDDLRRRDFQKFLDDDSVKAIVAARGGYGTVRILDDLDFRNFQRHPKWIIGFSDITILHSHIHACYQIQTIHGQMPLNVPDGTKPSLESLRTALFTGELHYEYESAVLQKNGESSGVLIGGNLTLLVMASGSVSEMDFDGKILFIEDVGEYLYSLDRMMYQLKRAGKLNNLRGLIVGAFSDMKDSDPPFGESVEEIILEKVKDYEYPVCFNFPAGHISDNHALIFGKKVNLFVKGFHTKVSFTNA